MEINILFVFLAGLGTFLTPCIIPIVPSYLSYISGFIIGKDSDDNKKNVFIHTIFFILGFGVAFSILQVLVYKFTNLAYKIVGGQQLSIILGVFVIIIGLNTLGLFKIKSLNKEKRIIFNIMNKNYFASFIFGFTFGFGWTPCMGPILFSIMTYLSNAGTLTLGVFYIWIFVLGMGIPFLIFAFFISDLKKLKFLKLDKVITISHIISGLVLIFIGILIAFNRLDLLNIF